jgi:hypothetical protein
MHRGFQHLLETIRRFGRKLIVNALSGDGHTQRSGSLSELLMCRVMIIEPSEDECLYELGPVILD